MGGSPFLSLPPPVEAIPSHLPASRGVDATPLLLPRPSSPADSNLSWDESGGQDSPLSPSVLCNVCATLASVATPGFAHPSVHCVGSGQVTGGPCWSVLHPTGCVPPATTTPRVSRVHSNSLGSTSLPSLAS